MSTTSKAVGEGLLKTTCGKDHKMVVNVRGCETATRRRGGIQGVVGKMLMVEQWRSRKGGSGEVRRTRW